LSLVLLASFTGAGCHDRVNLGEGGTGTVSTPDQLLATAENPALPIKVRAEAVSRLGDLKDRGAADRLIPLLPGQGDLLTLEVVVALGKMGGPKSLAALENLRDNDSIHLDGKIAAILTDSIERCKKNP